MLKLKTLNDVLYTIAANRGERAMLRMDAAGQWHPIGGMEVVRRVRAVAGALAAWGIRKGDRVALLGENRWEWAVADFATLALGAVNVPIYPTLTAGQTATLLADSGSRVAIVSTREQMEKVLSVRNRTALEHLVVMDEIESAVAVRFSSLIEGPEKMGEAAFEAAARAIVPNDLATIIYTSGTTGEPKGVMLTHGNIASNLNYSTAAFGFSGLDSCISFLPLSHITARHVDYALFAQGATVAYCSNFEALPTALKTVQPTIFVGVPRVYEKVRHEVVRRASLSPVKKRLFAWALRTGAKQRSAIEAGETPRTLAWRLADRLALGKIAAGFGGHVRYFIAGGAPLGVDTARWFADAGIRILEGYGLTETSPVLAINTPGAYRMVSVGKPLPNVECRFAADDELLVRGDSVFSGYWQKPQETAASFEGDKWFRTGDIGRMDADGFLFITDRKKELLKTSGGKLIAPQPIENRLKAYPLVGNAALVGDRHKFASAILAPNFASLESWAKQQGVAVRSRGEMITDPRVVGAYKEIVSHVNAGLANYETIKRFRLVADDWSIETGELTPSMKLKRRVITEKYADLIGSLYADEDSSSHI